MVFALLILFVCLIKPAFAAGTLDHYTLALSWSPSWCAREGARFDDDAAESQQCRPGARFGFVVHGLWPEFADGEAADCSGQPLFVPRRLAEEMTDLMPSVGLVFHEWRKHGTCSGLTQAAYFQLIRTLHDRIVIPPAFRQPARRFSARPGEIAAAFTAANRGLKPSMIEIACGSRPDRAWLREVRICFTADGAGFTPCRGGGGPARSCAADALVVPPVR